MDISRILTPCRVNLNLQASSKEAAIIELTELLFSDGAISDKEAFIRDVWLREAEGSTGFENHIAIPHGKSSAVKQTTLAIGRSQLDIPWRRWMAARCAASSCLPCGWKIKTRPIFACCHRWPVRWPMMR